MLPRTSVALLATLLFSLPVLSAQEKKEKTGEQARMLAEKFAKHLLARDVEAAMKLTSLPYYYGGSLHDGGTVVSSTDGVKKELIDFLRNVSDKNKGRVEIGSVISYEQAMKEEGNKIKPANRKLLDAVLEKGDSFVVLFLDVTGGNGKLHLVVLIGQRSGETRVLGHYSKGQLFQF